MIAEIKSVAVRRSSLPDRPNYLAIETLCDGDIKFVYLSSSAPEFFNLVTAFINVPIIDDMVDTDQFIGKLLPVEPHDEVYRGKVIHTIRFNYNGMKYCLCSYESPIETTHGSR